MRIPLILATLFLSMAANVQAADVADLINKLKDKDTDIRRAAALELIKAGPEAKDAAPALVLALKDTDAFVRRYSAQALGVVGGDAQTVAPALANLLRDGKERKEAQLAAVVSLTKFKAGAVPALNGAVRDPNVDTAVRRKIIDALGAIGVEARPALATLFDEYMGKNVPKGRATLQGEEKQEEKLALLEALEKLLTADDKTVFPTLADALINRNIPMGRGTLDQQEKAAVLTILEKHVTAQDKPIIATLSDSLAGRNLPKGANALPPSERVLLLKMLKKIAKAEDKVFVTALEAVVADDKLKDTEQLKKDAKDVLKTITEK